MHELWVEIHHIALAITMCNISERFVRLPDKMDNWWVGGGETYKGSYDYDYHDTTKQQSASANNDEWKIIDGSLHQAGASVSHVGMFCVCVLVGFCILDP